MKNHFRYASYAVTAIGVAIMGIGWNAFTSQSIYNYQLGYGRPITPVASFWLEMDSLAVFLIGVAATGLGVALTLLENRARNKRGELLSAYQHNTAFGLATLWSPTVFFGSMGVLPAAIYVPLSVVATIVLLKQQKRNTAPEKWRLMSNPAA